MQALQKAVTSCMPCKNSLGPILKAGVQLQYGSLHDLQFVHRAVYILLEQRLKPWRSYLLVVVLKWSENGRISKVHIPCLPGAPLACLAERTPLRQASVHPDTASQQLPGLDQMPWRRFAAVGSILVTRCCTYRSAESHAAYRMFTLTRSYLGMEGLACEAVRVIRSNQGTVNCLPSPSRCICTLSCLYTDHRLQFSRKRCQLDSLLLQLSTS
jgi:hypothetical protein